MIPEFEAVEIHTAITCSSRGRPKNARFEKLLSLLLEFPTVARRVRAEQLGWNIGKGTLSGRLVTEFLRRKVSVRVYSSPDGSATVWLRNDPPVAEGDHDA